MPRIIHKKLLLYEELQELRPLNDLKSTDVRLSRNKLH